MPTITHIYTANCPPAMLWAVLSDLSSVARTNPTVSTVQIVGAQTSGIGAVRKCALRPKGSVTERVTTYDEGRAVGLEVIESDWPISAMTWTTVIEPRPGGARLSQTLAYTMKFGPAGWLLNLLVLRRAITKNVGMALQGVIAEAEGRS